MKREMFITCECNDLQSIGKIYVKTMILTYLTLTGTSSLPYLRIPRRTLPSFSRTEQDADVNSTTALLPFSLRSTQDKLVVSFSGDPNDDFVMTLKYN